MPRAIPYGIVFALGIIGLSGTATMLGLIILVLPGLVLLIAPTLALYLPFADALVSALRRRFWWAALATGATWLGLFVMLPLSTNARLDRQLAITTSKDFGDPTAAAIGRLLLWDSPERAHASGACGKLCTRLLVRGMAKSVIVPMAMVEESPTLASGYAGEAAVYTLQPAEVCSPLDERELDADRDVLAAIGAGACIVSQLATAPDFDTALVKIAERTRENSRFNVVDIGIAHQERRDLWRCHGGTCRRVLTRTTVQTRRLMMPLVIGWRMSGRSIEREVARWDVTVNDTTDREVLGLNATFVPAPRNRAADPARIRQAAMHIMATTTDGPRPLTDAETVLVNDMLGALYSAPALGEDDDQLLAEILRHPKLNGEIQFPNFFRVRPEARDRLADDLIRAFDRLTKQERFDQARQRRYVAQEIGLLSPADFSRHQAGILPAAARDHALEDAPALVMNLGSYGVNALPALSAALEDRTLPTRHVALGLCRIGPDAASVAPRLAAKQQPDQRNNSLEDRAVALALARMGRSDLIVRPGPRGRLRPAVSSRLVRDWYEDLASVTSASPVTVCSEERMLLTFQR